MTEKEYQKAYYQRHKATLDASSTAWSRRNRDRHWGYVVKAKYGLSLTKYREILAQPCGICGGKATQLDHDHRTGRVRGGLCGACNRGIGMFFDNPILLEKAARYLNEPSIH